jgi:hypothetical protein
MNPNCDWKRKKFCIFAKLFSEVEVPIIRRSLSDETDRFSLKALEEYPELYEMDMFLRKNDVKNVSKGIRKRLATQQFKVKTRIQSWEFIRRFL